MKTESKIAKNLHINRKFNYDRVKEYHKKFIDSETGLIFENLSEQRPCPVCNSDDTLFLFHKSGGTYVKCKKCTMVYLNPTLKPDVLKDYYIHLDTGQGEIVAQETSFYNEIYYKGLNSVIKYVKPGKVLDIGCSTGFFLDICRKNSWETFGIELGEDEANIAKDKGHQIFKDTLDNIKATQKFEAITMWDVFEHIPNGTETLSEISKFLKPEGVLFMQIPNSGSLATRIMHEESNMFDGIEHVNLYNPNSIKYLADNCGYEILNLETVISELSVLKNYLNYENPYFGEQKGDDFLDLFDGNTVHENLLGYKMQLVMRKVKS